MATSSGVYVSDDLFNPGIGNPNSAFVTRKFKCTLSTALAQTGATKFLAGDIILLAPLPPQCNFVSYRIYTPILDTSTGISLNVGDTQVLSGAVTGVTSGTVTLPAI